MLTIGGSHAYGTNVDTLEYQSDIDIRGICLNNKEDLLGLGRNSFEQYVDLNTDTTIYALNKIVKLLCNCNPNCIELLGNRQEDYLYLSAIGRRLLENKQLFLSKRTIYSFGGYAQQQLRRLQNALARDSYPQKEKEKHILNSVQAAIMTFGDRYKKFEYGSLELFVDKSEQEDLDFEIFINVNLKKYPLRDYKNMQAEMQAIIKDYDKLNKRNKKKDSLHLNKHASTTCF